MFSSNQKKRSFSTTSLAFLQQACLFYNRSGLSTTGLAFLQQVWLSYKRLSALLTRKSVLCPQATVSGLSTGNRVCSVNIEHAEHCQEVLNMAFGARNGSSWLRFHFCEVEMKPTGSTKLFRLLPDPKTAFKINIFHRYLENQKIRDFPYIFPYQTPDIPP